ncbi:MAG: DNA repair protein RecO [Phycisphaerae bacterium]|nr:DNA repair protein RecO [Phycisphaerae bacterium]
MPALRDEGICLRHWDWSETSQTVSVFGRSLGVLRGLAKGARRERGRFGGGIDLLSRGEFGVIVKPTTELATFTDWDLLETFPGLRDSLPANRISFYAADLVARMVAPADPHPGLYDEFASLLRAVGGRSSPDRAQEVSAQTEQAARTAQALLRFQWRLLQETGVQPALDAEGRAATLWFDPRSGGFTEIEPEHGWRVRRETLELLRRVNSGADGVSSAPLETLDRANRLLAAHLRETLQMEPPTLTHLFGNLLGRSTRSGPRPI